MPETKHKTIEEITSFFQRKYKAKQEKKNGAANVEIKMDDMPEANKKTPNDVENAEAPIASDKLL